jgi:RHS repeat-associated protein
LANTHYGGQALGFCAFVSVHDSVTANQAPLNNFVTVQIFDACGTQVFNQHDGGWRTVGQNYFSSGEVGSPVYVIPTSGVCWGQWTANDSFTQTFTDNQTLTDTQPVTFSVLPVGPVPINSDGKGDGEATRHDPICKSGDPVNCASGNFSETYTDVSVPGRGPALDLTRTYNSLSASATGIFGFGWTSSYEAHLTVNSDSSVSVTEPDGSSVTAQPGSGANYVVPAFADSTLTHNADGSWSFVRQADLTYTFDANGRLTAITDRNGYATTLSYNAAGQLSTVTDSAGRTLTFTFGTNGFVSQVADPLTQTTTYGYDTSGNLTSVSDPLTRATGFGYDPSHFLQTVTDPRLGVVTNVYDTSGRVTQQTDQAGLITHFVYSGDNYSTAGGTTTITDPHGSVTVEHYTSGVMLSLTKASGTSAAATWSYGYDPKTDGITSATDPNNHATASTFDGAGNLLTQKDALNRTTTYTYNAFNEPLTVTDPAGIKTTYTYDGQGNLLTKSVAGIGGTPVETTTYSYTDGHAGDTTEITDAASHVSDYTYDTQGDVATTTTHPDTGINNTAEYVYDVLGRKVCEASPTATAAGVHCPVVGQPRVARTTTWAFDAGSELLNETDPLGNSTSYVYDGDGNRTQVTDPIGNVTNTVYDLDSRKTSVTVGFGASGAATTNYVYDIAPAATGSCLNTVSGATYCTTTTDPSSQVTIDYFNARNQKIKEVQPSSGTSTSTYDSAGNLATLTTVGGTATYGYDAGDQLTSITYSLPASGYAAAPNVSYGYDADGHRTSMTDGTGTTSYTYDTLDRLQSTTNGAGAVVSYGYDLDNEVTSIVYPGTSHTVTQAWDGAGREKSVTDWLSHTTNFSYDADGNLVTEALPNTTTITSTYDAADNVLSTKDALNSTPTSPFASFAYTYNADQQVQTETDTGTPAPTSETYGYDPLSRLQSSSSASYGYNASGDPTQLGSATQSFNAAHELTSQAQTITRVGTNSAGDAGTGATLSLTLPAGTTANDQIILAVTLPGSQSIKSTPSGYTAVGTFSSGTGASNVKLAVYRRTAVAGDTSVSITFSKTFAKAASLIVYRGVNPTTPIDVSSSGTTATGTSVTATSVTTTKANDQLVLAESAESSTAGTFTAPSGMTTRVPQPGGPTTTGAIADQTLAVTGATGSRTATFSVSGSLAAALIALQPAQTTYTYDTLGDRKTVTTPSGTTTLAYDQLGRMTTYASTTYTYNGDGLRMSKTVGRTTTQETWALGASSVAPQLLVEGALDYLYAPDGLPLEQINGSTVVYYVHDQLGSTRLIVNSTGGISSSYTYSAYGTLVGSTGSVSNPLGFAGAYTDTESGSLYLEHRYYDPAAAQFVSVDPAVAASHSAYDYVLDDPLDLSDPTGLHCWSVHCLTRDAAIATATVAVVATVALAAPEIIVAAGAVEAIEAADVAVEAAEISVYSSHTVAEAAVASADAAGTTTSVINTTYTCVFHRSGCRSALATAGVSYGLANLAQGLPAAWGITPRLLDLGNAGYGDQAYERLARCL